MSPPRQQYSRSNQNRKDSAPSAPETSCASKSIHRPWEQEQPPAPILPTASPAFPRGHHKHWLTNSKGSNDIDIMEGGGASAAGAGSYVVCTGCHEAKPESEFSRSQLISRRGRQQCQACMSIGSHTLPPARVAPAAGEGHVRCVACCQLKPTSSFGTNQLRRRAGIERCMACVETDMGALVLCNACRKQKPFTDFSKKQLACKPGLERCKDCIELSG